MVLLRWQNAGFPVDTTEPVACQIKPQRMHCSNCGSYIAPGVRFCSGCGSPANDPEVTRIVRCAAWRSRCAGEDDYIAPDDDLEAVIFTVRPTMIFIKLGYALAVLGGNCSGFPAGADSCAALTSRSCWPSRCC